MIGKHIGSLEGRAAEIEYDRLSHSYKEEEYGKHIAELILKQSYGIEDYSEQIPSEYIIWQDNKYALLFDKYECIFDLFQISDNTNESVKASAKLIRLTESDLHRIVKESVNKIIQEITVKGKSGKEHYLGGRDPYSWFTVNKIRQKQINDPKRTSNGREEHNMERDFSNAQDLYHKWSSKYPDVKTDRWYNKFDKETTDAAEDLY